MLTTRILIVFATAACLYAGCATAGNANLYNRGDDASSSGDDDGSVSHPDSGGRDGGSKDGSPPPDSGGGDTSSGNDASPPFDAGGCSTVTPSPAPPSHGGAQCSGGSGNCFPHDESAFSPSWIAPVGAKQGACSSQQVSAYYNDCLGTSASQSLCTAWQGANASCYNCLFTDSTAPSYGALVGYGALVNVNLAGCVALSEPCNLSCAKTMQADVQCYNRACDPSQNGNVCPVTNQTSFNTYNTCVSSATSCSACQGFAQSDNSCEMQIDVPGHNAYADCFGGKAIANAQFQDLYNAVAAFMCE